MDVEIKILGPGCKKCEETANLVRKVAEEHGIAVQVEKIANIETSAEFGIAATPAVVVDGDVKCAGRVPTAGEILNWLRKHAAGS